MRRPGKGRDAQAELMKVARAVHAAARVEPPRRHVVLALRARMMLQLRRAPAGSRGRQPSAQPRQRPRLAPLQLSAHSRRRKHPLDRSALRLRSASRPRPNARVRSRHLRPRLARQLRPLPGPLRLRLPRRSSVLPRRRARLHQTARAAATSSRNVPVRRPQLPPSLRLRHRHKPPPRHLPRPLRRRSRAHLQVRPLRLHLRRRRPARPLPHRMLRDKPHRRRNRSILRGFASTICATSVGSAVKVIA